MKLSEKLLKEGDGIFRLACGVGIFAAIISILKLPFSNEFLESNYLLSHIVRALRYGIGAFTVIGIYPMIFNYFERKRAK